MNEVPIAVIITVMLTVTEILRALTLGNNAELLYLFRINLKP